jgi:phosphatidylserine/phosphatidylglycerophosphate/cardiolipin synthase-like enzyme
VAGLIERLTRALSGRAPAPAEAPRGTPPEKPVAETDLRARPPDDDAGKAAALEQKLRDAREEIEALEGGLRTTSRERDAHALRIAALEEERRLLEGRIADVARSEKRAEEALREAEVRLARRARRETEPDDEAERREKLVRRARTAELSAENLAAQLARVEEELREQRSAARRSERAVDLDADGPPRLEVLFSPGPDCLEGILSCLRSARRTIDVCVFTITDDRIAEALLDAHDRRVSVRVITDNDKASDRGSDVWKLERRGVPVRVDRTEFHMHHKFAVFDGSLALTGSYNWTRGAARDNEENLVISDAPRFVEAFQGEFERLWRQLDPG